MRSPDALSPMQHEVLDAHGPACVLYCEKCRMDTSIIRMVCFYICVADHDSPVFFVYNAIV